MKNLNLSELEAAWQFCPWGIAAISSNGQVVAVNPAFERCTNIPNASVIGMMESEFDALLLNDHLLVRNRIETNGENLRALHYMQHAAACTGNDLRLSRAAETLREPLASIYGFTELLLTQNYDEDTRRDLTSTLLEQVEVMSNLINEHLDKSKREMTAYPRIEL